MFCKHVGGSFFVGPQNRASKPTKQDTLKRTPHPTHVGETLLELSHFYGPSLVVAFDTSETKATSGLHN